MTMSIKRNIKTILKLLQRKKVTKADIVLLSPNQRLVRKKVIITGGNRGLGFAMAKKFTDEGAEVLITGRDEEKLEKAAKEIGCKYMQYDVTDFTHMDEFIKEADDLLGGANVLVNNAGISLHEGTIMDVHYEQFDKQIETNLKGACFFVCMRKSIEMADPYYFYPQNGDIMLMIYLTDSLKLPLTA